MKPNTKLIAVMRRNFRNGDGVYLYKQITGSPNNENTATRIFRVRSQRDGQIMVKGTHGWLPLRPFDIIKLEGKESGSYEVR